MCDNSFNYISLKFPPVTSPNVLHHSLSQTATCTQLITANWC